MTLPIPLTVTEHAALAALAARLRGHALSGAEAGAARQFGERWPAWARAVLEAR